jgi:hypothetical protein
VAALLKEELGVDPTVEPGARGEFSAWVDGRRVARRYPVLGLPSDGSILRRVRRALPQPA